MSIEVFTEKPSAFNARVEVAACFVECQGKLLYLQYAMDHPTEGGKWGIPGGKLEDGESPTQGALRELFEETAICASQLKCLGLLFIRKKGAVEYVFHMFHLQICHAQVRLSDEHSEYRWLTAEEVKQLSIVSGGNEALQWFLQRK